MEPIESAPYWHFRRLNSAAAWLIATSQLTGCQGSRIDLRIIGVVMRSAWVA